MSEQAKHTPGPWEATKEYFVYGMDPVGKGNALVADCNPYRICESGIIDPERWDANARLIAAAPDLYAAAVELRAALIDGCGEATKGPKRRRLVAAGAALDAAIAKAEWR